LREKTFEVTEKEMKPASTGRAKTILVFGGGEDARGVISSIIAHAYEGRKTG
jgi:hypothetical protein